MADPLQPRFETSNTAVYGTYGDSPGTVRRRAGSGGGGGGAGGYQPSWTYEAMEDREGSSTYYNHMGTRQQRRRPRVKLGDRAPPTDGSDLLFHQQGKAGTLLAHERFGTTWEPGCDDGRNRRHGEMQRVDGKLQRSPPGTTPGADGRRSPRRVLLGDRAREEPEVRFASTYRNPVVEVTRGPNVFTDPHSKLKLFDGPLVDDTQNDVYTGHVQPAPRREFMHDSLDIFSDQSGNREGLNAIVSETKATIKGHIPYGATPGIRPGTAVRPLIGQGGAFEADTSTKTSITLDAAGWERAEDADGGAIELEDEAGHLPPFDAMRPRFTTANTDVYGTGEAGPIAYCKRQEGGGFFSKEKEMTINLVRLEDGVERDVEHDRTTLARRAEHFNSYRNHPEYLHDQACRQ